MKWLPIAAENGSNIMARKKMAVSATMGGWLLGHATAHAGHAIAHAIGGKFHVPHGLACAYVLPYVIAYEMPYLSDGVQVRKPEN